MPEKYYQRIYRVSLLATFSLRSTDVKRTHRHSGAPPDEDDPAVIYLCKGFRARSRPIIGSYSKAGTLIHEATHFGYNDRYLPTVDYADFHKGSQNLARKDPYLAVTNAENYAFFAENKPRYN